MKKLDRINTKYILLEIDDLNHESSKQEDKRKEILSLIATNTQIKVQEKCVALFDWIQNGGKLNTVILRTIDLLMRDGHLTFGIKGNLYRDLLLQPYTTGTANAQAGQMASLLPMLKIVLNNGAGTFVPNPKSILLMRLKIELGLTP